MSLNRFPYRVTASGNLDDATCRQLSDLFSTNYGKYSACAVGGRAGKAIRLPASHYRRLSANPDYRIAQCYDGARLIAHAVYLIKDTERGRVAFVVQLVVDARYRLRGIASTLLHAIWGFSDFYAWGIVTSNPSTVKALEAATFRSVSAAKIAGEFDFLRRAILSDVDFVKDCTCQVDGARSVANTRFYTVREENDVTDSVSGRLGRLAEGEEWLAFTFRGQPLDNMTGFASLYEDSDAVVKEAYARMNSATQTWNRRSGDEIRRILGWLPKLGKDAVICDFGAGNGRHLKALAELGYLHASGVDFFASQDGPCKIVEGDCATWRSPEPCDLILCLYDVVGSSIAEGKDAAVIRNIADNLKVGGHAIVSVLNYGLIKDRADGKIDGGDRAGFLQALYRLPVSGKMQSSGEIFDTNAMLVDEQRHIVYRKEQFPEAINGRLPGEYIVADRRYEAGEIRRLHEDAGLDVQRMAFVNAGFGEREPATAKEIVLVSRRR